MSLYVEAQKNTGNDRQAIQDAIRQAVEQNYGTVYVGKGDWHLDGCLLLENSVHLIFDACKIFYEGGRNAIAICNSNAIKPSCNIIEAQQKNISITGKNGATLIGGTIFFTNVSFSQIRGMRFENCDNFSVILTSVLAIKVRECCFGNSANGIAVGTGARDCYFLDLQGELKENFFVFSDYLYEEYRRHHRDFMVFNHIVRNINCQAKKLAVFYGKDVERIVFCDVKAEISDVVFDCQQGKHITISNIQANGKLFNENIEKYTFHIVK